ncbi:MAG: molybdopterin molybdotransferase [Planctomycetota bacterium]|jgi:molybdopterin molybdotransferase
MTINIHIPSPLRRYSNGESLIAVEGSTIGEAFESLFELLPPLKIRLINARDEIHPYLILLHGSDEISRSDWRQRVLGEGDEIDIVPAVEGGSDVRMRGFRDRATVADALAYTVSLVNPRFETAPLGALAGRVLAEDVTSRVNVPAFNRSAMDGFAVVAEDTFGATSYNPIELELCGESMPGNRKLEEVKRGQACRIMTGAPMPPGADAVLMAEDVDAQGDKISARASVTPHKNVGRIAEDIAVGQTVLSFDRRLRPQDVGLLASIGRSTVRSYAAPRVMTLVTGNELLPPGELPRDGFIVDSNSPMLAALTKRDGAVLLDQIHLPDDIDIIREFLLSLKCDVLLCAGGSSVGREDFLPVLVNELGELSIHGVAMRPSAPTGIGRIKNTPVFLLPGNPVSCLSAYDHFAGPLIRALGGRPQEFPYARVKKTLSRRIASQIGRQDYVRVALDEDDKVTPIALSGASLLSSTTLASGFVIVNEDSEGVDAEAEVSVYLYDEYLG